MPGSIWMKCCSCQRLRFLEIVAWQAIAFSAHSFNRLPIFDHIGRQ